MRLCSDMRVRFREVSGVGVSRYAFVYCTMLTCNRRGGKCPSTGVWVKVEGERASRLRGKGHTRFLRIPTWTSSGL